MVYKRNPSPQANGLPIRKLKVYVIFGKEGGRERRPVCKNGKEEVKEGGERKCRKGNRLFFKRTYKGVQMQDYE